MTKEVITFAVIIALVTYVLGAIVKLKIDKIPNKYIPIQNVVIGVIAGFISWLLKIEPNLALSIIYCLMATTSAGGIADLVNRNNYMKQIETTSNNEEDLG